MKIVLVDDHRIFVEGLSRLMDDTHQVLASFSDPTRVPDFIKANDADLLIADYEMPGLNGIELFEKCKAINPLLKGVLLSMHDETPLIRQAMKAGFHGYLLKNVSRQELLTALEKISNGHRYISAELTKALIEPENTPQLSAREREVLKLILKEYTNKQIADALHLSERTVETYRKNLFKKANATNIVGLIKFAFAHNLAD